MYYTAEECNNYPVNQSIIKASNISDYVQDYDLVSYEEKPAKTKIKKAAMKQQKVGNKPMYNELDVNVSETNNETKRIQYLMGRLSNIHWELSVKLPKKFGYQDSENSPNTLEELTERLASKKYMVMLKSGETISAKDYDPKVHKLCRYGSLFASILWQDPDIKEDEEGLKKAREELQAAYMDAKDQINIVDPKEGLEALKKFEIWTPSNLK